LLLRQNNLKKEAFFEINKQLDVVNLLKKLSEIEKLKNLILNEKQMVLFEEFFTIQEENLRFSKDFNNKI